MEKMSHVYIRWNDWWESLNIVKLGITISGKDRDSVYATGEPNRGSYLTIIEVPSKQLKCIDNLLKFEFKQEQYYKAGGGTEFYNKSIIDLIEPFLKKLNINYRFLTMDEILNIERQERLASLSLCKLNKIKKYFKKINIKKIIQLLINKRTSLNCITPNEQQQFVLSIIEDFYRLNNIGKIIWACGLGKTILFALIVKLMKFKSVVIGVPSNNLQNQFAKDILKVFPNKSNILFVGGDDINSTTNKENIKQFMKTPILTGECLFIITTYHSCHLLADDEFSFDYKCGDEAHHLVGIEKEEEEERGFRLFHKISSFKTLFMTATEKIIVKNSTFRREYSMNDEEIFGKYIDIKTVFWAIENKKITDYNVLVLKNKENDIDDLINTYKIDVKNKELFVSCYMCLLSFEEYKNLTHLLLYTNTTEDAELASQYINDILNLNLDELKLNKEDIYNNALHSKSKTNLEEELNKFVNSKYGIIACVYIFGEGFNLPKLNGVCIAGNMNSEIRIIQYILRPNRLEFGNPDKIAYIIIPYIDYDDWDNNNKSFEKPRSILAHLRNVDENIEQKIIVLSLEKKEKDETDETDETEEIKDETETLNYNNFELVENCDKLSNIKLRLRHSKSLSSKLTEEQDEFNYVKSINKSLNIQSKLEYFNSNLIHRNFIRNPEEYFKLKGVWSDWYDFMGTDTKNFIQSKEEWIKFCRNKKITNDNDYNEACNLYDVLPKEPEEFYVGFTNIKTELKLSFRR